MRSELEPRNRNELLLQATSAARATRTTRWKNQHDNPANDLNLGQLFTDRSDDILLNQFVLTLEKPLDPKKVAQFQMGFKVQSKYGSPPTRVTPTSWANLTR